MTKILHGIKSGSAIMVVVVLSSSIIMHPFADSFLNTVRGVRCTFSFRMVLSYLVRTTGWILISSAYYARTESIQPKHKCNPPPV